MCVRAHRRVYTLGVHAVGKHVLRHMRTPVRAAALRSDAAPALLAHCHSFLPHLTCVCSPTCLDKWSCRLNPDASITTCYPHLRAAPYMQDGTTPLHHASNRGLVEVMRLLLDKGAEVDKSCTVGPQWD